MDTSGYNADTYDTYESYMYAPPPTHDTDTERYTYILHTQMIHVYRWEIHVSDVYQSVSVSRYTQIRIESKVRHF